MTLSFGRGKHFLAVNTILAYDLISDDTAHANESVFTRFEVIETIEVISEKIATVGLPVFPALGNHDIIPKNQVIEIFVRGYPMMIFLSSQHQTQKIPGQHIMRK